MQSFSKIPQANVLIRKAERSDMPAVVELIQEHANYENQPTGPRLAAEDLQKDGFDSQPGFFKCLLAEHLFQYGPRAVGYAIYFPIYSTWEGRALQLEELYVSSGMRNKGVGHKLFDAVAKEAYSTNCARLDFHALDWREANAFYESMGAENLAENDRRTYYRLTRDALRDYGAAKSF